MTTVLVILGIGFVVFVIGFFIYLSVLAEGYSH